MSHESPFPSERVREIIAHINAEHADDVLTFALYACQLNNKNAPTSAKLLQINAQGLLFLVAGGAEHHEVLLKFIQPLGNIDDLHSRYVALLQIAGKATNRPYIIDTQDRLIVQAVENIGNFIRITAILPDDTPTDKAGFAYLFKINDNDVRYYTLRKAWRDNGNVIGFIDIFTHDDTLGSLWAKNIKAGEHLISKRRYPEKTEHLHGQVLLIGDETSLPTVLRILELQTFDNPIVVACLHNANDEIYLKECQMPYIMLNYDQPNELLPKILALLDEKIANNIHINSVWTAMESELIKQLRKAFKTKLGLEKGDMTVKVYWRLD